MTAPQTTRAFFAALTIAVLPHAASAQSERATLDPTKGWQQESVVADDPARQELDRARTLIAEDQPGKARDLLDKWLNNDEFSASQYRPEALRLRGDAKLAAGREFKALFDYEELIRTYPESTEYVTAIEREVDIAKMYLAGLNKRLFGVRISNAEHFGETLLLRAQERMPGSLLAESSAIALADYYFDKRKLELAAEMYDIFLKSYPNSPHRMHAMQRHVYSNIARFKGPKYDGSILLESRLLIERFARDYPAEAERAGLTNALVVRLEESAAAQQLESAEWYLRTGDGPAGRLVLTRLIRDHTGTVAATKGLQILQERGWLEDETRTIEVAPIGPEPTP